MNKAFEKIVNSIKELADYNGNAYIDSADIIEIVQEVAEECKGDMKHNLAEMYAKNMVDYGVDVTKEWQTATQQSCALEKAYIRGRQYEADRFNELRKEYNNGWIPCSERLPSGLDFVLYTCKDGEVDICSIEYFYDYLNKFTAWQPLPSPFREIEVSE